MAEPRKMTLNRNHVLTSLLGHSIRFEKGVPVDVPPVLYAEVLAIGGEFADGEGLAAPVTIGTVEPVDPVERAAVIFQACLAIAEKNDNRDFTASGAPKPDAVSAAVSFKVSAKDVAKAWQQRADKIAEEKGFA